MIGKKALMREISAAARVARGSEAIGHLLTMGIVVKKVSHGAGNVYPFSVQYSYEIGTRDAVGYRRAWDFW